MNLSMAVRAEKNAFLQLSLRLLPRACDPVLGDAEVLRRAIEVVELEHLMRTTERSRRRGRRDARPRAASVAGDIRPSLPPLGSTSRCAGRGGSSRKGVHT